MKKLVICIMLLLPTALIAQTENTIDIAPVAPPAAKSDMASDTAVFVFVEQMPEFPGGMKALQKFLADSIVYPQEAKEMEIEGRVVVSFVVEPDGKISNIKVVKSVSGLLDNEALRVVSKMPAWKPGKNNGKPLRVQYTLPISFKLQ